MKPDKYSQNFDIRIQGPHVMKMKMKILLASIVLMTVAASSLADVTISMSHESQGQVLDTTLSFAGQQVRMDSPQGGVILTPSNDEMIMLMHAQKQYMKRSINQTAAMNPSSEPAAKDISFKRTGQQQVISGFTCEEVIATEADGDIVEFWLSKDSVHTDDFLKSMKVFDKLQNKANGGNQLEAWEVFIKDHPELSTFPIRTINKNAAGQIESVMTVTSISRKSIPGSHFKVPTGYSSIGGAGVPAPGEVATATPKTGGQSQAAVMQELQALQREIQQNGGQPTPEQMKRLQELASRFKSQ